MKIHMNMQHKVAVGFLAVVVSMCCCCAANAADIQMPSFSPVNPWRSPVPGSPRASVPPEVPDSMPPSSSPSPGTAQVAPSPTESEVEEPEEPEEDYVYYANCAEARAAGAAPIYRGEPGYRKGLDRDGDGKACDR